MTIGELIGLDEIFMKESARRFFTKNDKLLFLRYTCISNENNSQVYMISMNMFDGGIAYFNGLVHLYESKSINMFYSDRLQYRQVQLCI